MTEIRIAAAEDIDMLMEIRLEMLKAVNGLDEGYVFSDEIKDLSRKYFLEGDQTTVLAFVDGELAGCASASYIRIMPTFSHPTGKRAHIMNVYTKERFRRQGIAYDMMTKLIEEAWEKGATEISLDATSSGRPLYEKLGFSPSDEYMVMVRN
ncbi:MAG: GNAT family N-acetyltransferase [Saccharofermentans sp.]|nr:GNAT family N-acetyltransferase [Saccharofermentans sp.]